MGILSGNASETRGGSSAGTRRVFFALWPDMASRERIAAVARDVVQRAGGRAPRAENHHLTLAFVGEVEVVRIPALKSIGELAVRSVQPFALSLDCIGEFHHTGIAWLGCAAVPVELQRLVRALREALAAEGFLVEQRHFRPHLTLARRCGTLADAAIAPIAWQVERITLTASSLRPAGPRYRELAAWPLFASK
jgi:RNA 2',3'-cyclic 3'-phosphodiesterase